jgi:hypothetical protein
VGGESADSDAGLPVTSGPPLPPSAQRISDLVGLRGVRRAVTGQLADLARRREVGQPVGGRANLAFAGDDGSGRRAVAELYARALAELGLVATGALDWVPLTDFPARWPGQAERYAEWLLARTDGGLLFLEADEMFADRLEVERTRVLEALPRALRRFPDAVLVLAGDDALLSGALRDVEELAECFAEYVRFDAYSAPELAELAARRLTARGCTVGEGVSEALTEYFLGAVAGTGAWDAHRLAAYLSEVVPGPVITATDLSGLLSSESPEMAS